MSTVEGGRKLGGIKTVVYGRTVVILLGFLAQLALLYVGYILLRNYGYVTYGLFLTVTAVAVLYIFNAPGNPDLKLSWMLPIAVLPVFGAIFYVTISAQPGIKVMYNRLKALSEYTKKYVLPGGEAGDRLRAECRHMGQLAHYLENYDNSPVYDAGVVKYYPLGDCQYVDMMEELGKAEKFIFMEFFIVAEGRMLETILALLREKARQGVEVRFMCDGTNVLWNLPGSFPRMLEQEGIRCKMFAPIKPIFSPHYNNRDHRKILVIDGHTAFNGGVNLADEYINRVERFGHWKDTAVMVRGEAARSFTLMFLQMWSIDEKEIEFQRFLAHPVPCRKEAAGYVIPYGDCPLDGEKVGERVYMDILYRARRYVHIMTPYLILDGETETALKYAAERGVEVALVLPGIPDKRIPYALAKTHYTSLLESGVQIYEYTPGFVHAKVFVSDDREAVVGTINLDYRSLYHHFECATYMYGTGCIPRIEEDFQATVEKCRRITSETVKAEKLTVKLTGILMKVAAPLL